MQILDLDIYTHLSLQGILYTCAIIQSANHVAATQCVELG